MWQNVIVASLMFFFTQEGLAKAACDKGFKQIYAKGDVDGKPADKVYNFKKIRDDLLHEVDGSGDADRMSCLQNFYEKALSEAGTYWGERLHETSCQDRCKQEFEKSKKYLTNLDQELKTKIKEKLTVSKSHSSSACTSRSVDFSDVKNIKSAMCCGKPDVYGSGTIRGMDPSLTYAMCLEKSSPTRLEMISVRGITDCVLNLAKSALMTLYTNIKSTLSMATEFFSILSEIWKLMTNRDALKAFAEKLMGGVSKYIGDRVVSVTSCLNPYEQSQFICKSAGDLIGHIATPGAMLKLFKLLKSGGSLTSGFVGDLLGQSAGGRKALDHLSKIKSGAEEGLKRIGQGKSSLQAKAGSALAKSILFTSIATNFAAKENAFLNALNEASIKFKELGAKAVHSVNQEAADNQGKFTGPQKREALKNADVEDLIEGPDGKFRQIKTGADSSKEELGTQPQGDTKLGAVERKSSTSLQEAGRQDPVQSAVDSSDISTDSRRSGGILQTAKKELPAKSYARSQNLDDPRYFVRDSGDSIRSPNYIKNAVESIDQFDGYWSSAKMITAEDLAAETKKMHKVAGLGKQGKTPYNGAANNKYISYGEFHESLLANSRPSDIYAKAIAEKYGLGPVVAEGPLFLEGVPVQGQPKNLGSRHFYPSPAFFNSYFEQGAKILNRLRSTANGSKEALDLISDYYQLMANARPFDNINNSLFMSQTNYFLKQKGFSPMGHGYLDHLAQRLTPDQFRRAFQIQNSSGLPLPDNKIIKDLSAILLNDLFYSPFTTFGEV